MKARAITSVSVEFGPGRLAEFRNGTVECADPVLRALITRILADPSRVPYAPSPDEAAAHAVIAFLEMGRIVNMKEVEVDVPDDDGLVY